MEKEVIDYEKLLIDAVLAKNWDEVIRLGNEVKFNSNHDTVFGIKKGYINLFRGHSEETYKGLSKLDYKCYFGYDPNIHTRDFINNNYVVIFTNEGVPSTIVKAGLNIQFFSVTTRRYHAYDSKKKSYTRNYVETETKKYKFDSFDQMIGELRDTRINEIFED